MRSELEQLKQVEGELTHKNRVSNKYAGQGTAVRRMIPRTCEEKRVIICLLDLSKLPKRFTLAKGNVPRSSFYGLD
jgi:hypothetical protein